MCLVLPDARPLKCVVGQGNSAAEQHLQEHFEEQQRRACRGSRLRKGCSHHPGLRPRWASHPRDDRCKHSCGCRRPATSTCHPWRGAHHHIRRGAVTGATAQPYCHPRCRLHRCGVCRHLCWLGLRCPPVLPQGPATDKCGPAPPCLTSLRPSVTYQQLCRRKLLSGQTRMIHCAMHVTVVPTSEMVYYSRSVQAPLLQCHA